MSAETLAKSSHESSSPQSRLLKQRQPGRSRSTPGLAAAILAGQTAVMKIFAKRPKCTTALALPPATKLI